MKHIFLATLLCLTATALQAEEPTFAGTEIVSGFEPHIEVRGLPAATRIRVHSMRMFSVWERAPNGGWLQVAKPLHAWVDLATDDKGAAALWLASPLAGTYSGIDPYGILWSGRQVIATEPDAYLPQGFNWTDLKVGDGAMIATVDRKVVARKPIRFVSPPGLHSEFVAKGRINGAYAVPDDGKRHPVVILLHGSEGGNKDASVELAHRFAGQGFAAFAFNYFAWDLAGLDGVPNAHVNQPIEMITAVRNWLAEQPGADVSQVGLYGHSKGAEYAEVAAIHLPWIKAVAGCVPTDAVWQGYGIGDERNRTNSFGTPPEQYSSFSWKGQPLSYIPLDGDRGAYHSNTDFYEAKRDQQKKHAAELALIAIEKSKAQFLWLGGGRDDVWASGKMARHLDARLTANGADARSELHVYDRAGHAICGDGTYPTRLWNGDSLDPRDPDRDAEGRATADGWDRIKKFFARTLVP